MTPHDELGPARQVRLPQGELRYFDRGTGAPVVFVHGVLTSALLWRKVVPAVAEAGFRCLAPDLPFGAHRVAMRADADLSAPGAATLFGDFLDALDLRDVTLVANDTGGAITQLLLARYPERVGRVVLTPSDSFEYFFPPVFKPLPVLARVPGSMAVLGQLLRFKALYPLPFVFGWVTKRPIPDDIAREYLTPLRTSAGVRRDLRKLLRSVHPRHTLAAAERLRTFDRPVLLVWPPEEKLFPISLAHRLAELLPHAELVEVPDSYTFVPEDQPDVLAGHIKRFAAAMAD
ncbi:pimeloyl-ACP methyl ester carboxylesterase [Amycolatopsis sulphurea]|uniref:Pimeloyl-ACP methyl ester carboxylesterase n=1 Tax=Amycolatopsis sulphurea TaxID=76022 RepID=A0A2A9F506_9PSEU|nr:alpha/beta fold hydrolase [Amycolatopsis sulphurea]PFG46467.1 pimeloyl-ACP methyl ester carboxylesterase [Amycolatopsis sulphurea]